MLSVDADLQSRANNSSKAMSLATSNDNDVYENTFHAGYNVNCDCEWNCVCDYVDDYWKDLGIDSIRTLSSYLIHLRRLIHLINLNRGISPYGVYDIYDISKTNVSNPEGTGHINRYAFNVDKVDRGESIRDTQYTSIHSQRTQGKLQTQRMNTKYRNL